MGADPEAAKVRRFEEQVLVHLGDLYRAALWLSRGIPKVLTTDTPALIQRDRELGRRRKAHACIGTEGRGRRWVRYVVAASLPVALAVALAAEIPRAQAQGRVIHMAAVEMKGGTQKEKEPYPETPLPLGAGYVKTPPNAAGRWEVSAYQWSPGTIVVQQGETVTLEIVGVNGDVHPATIPGIVDSFTVKRGEITRIIFTASKPGLYSIICTKHVPSMRGTLVVLPK